VDPNCRCHSAITQPSHGLITSFISAQHTVRHTEDALASPFAAELSDVPLNTGV